MIVPCFAGSRTFTVVIHHGGRFHSNGGLNRVYRDGEAAVYVDGVVPESLSVAGFNYWANDLGYLGGPISYWFRILGSEEGSGYLPICTYANAMDMRQFIPKTRGILEIYIVCFGARRQFEEYELEQLNEVIHHMNFYVESIEDLPLADDEAQPAEDPLLVNEDHMPDEEPIIEEQPNHASDPVYMNRMFNDDAFLAEIFGDGSYNGPRHTAPKVTMDKDKGKEKVVEQPKKKVGRHSEESDDSEDVDYDAVVDSDFELHEEDDEVQFYSLIDGAPDEVVEFEEMGYSGNISDEEAIDSDGFQSVHDSDNKGEDVGHFKVKGEKRFSKWVEFNLKTDMKNPRLCLGMVFPNSSVLKNAIRKYGVLTKKELRFPRNTKHHVLARCKTSPDCPFWIYASSPSNDNPTLQIRTFKPEHMCSFIRKRVYHCNATFLAAEYKDVFLTDGKWSREGIQNAVNRDFGMDIGYQLAYSAKAMAKKVAQGTIEDQYSLLKSYAAELKRRNTGTSVWIQTELEGEVARFKRIYICFATLKEGWIAGCIPIIGLDGCHLKGVHKDKQKGLGDVIKDLFPEAEHRHCVRHLHNNFKGDEHTELELKQLLWAVARATTMNQYTKAMEDMKKTSPAAWKYESFNKTILDARKKPILPCLEGIRVASMVRLANRRNSGARWRCKVGPRIEKLLKKNAAWANEYMTLESSLNRFELQGRGVCCESGVIAQHSVQLDTMSCTCRRWNLCGLPCGHAIAAIYSKCWLPDDYVSEWYTLKLYMQSYEVMLNPISGVHEWVHIERKIAPPLYKRQPGRPKTKKPLEPGEAPPPTGIEKLPRTYYAQVNCGECGKKGHNKRTCARRNQVPNANFVVEEENVQALMPEENQAQPQSPNEAPHSTQESSLNDVDHVVSQASFVPCFNHHDTMNVNVNGNDNDNVN
ncbi:hypothetical protein ACLB2K_047999 [Fragaria x ananassa]